MRDGLETLAYLHGTDKCYEVHRYTMVYRLLFEPIRDDVKKVVEIGILKGSSLRLWQEYFPNAEILGIDNDEKSFINYGRIKSVFGDQKDKESLLKAIQSMSNDVDIIIDDGSHLLDDQMITFDILFQFVKKGGFYIIEDIVDIDAFKSKMQYSDYFFAVLDKNRGSVLAVIKK